MSIIIETPKESEKIKKLLAKDIPSYRQAYSDRTAFIMACLSELAYIKFNKPLLDSTNKRLMENITKLLGEGKVSAINKLIDLVAYDSEEEKIKLESELGLLNLQLEKTFDKNGTQAMIVSTNKFYVLAFRGTETTSLKDIKADLKVKQTACETSGNMHQGFKDAFAEVHNDLQKYIDENIQDKPLFITGHSLGGALATVASKKIKNCSIAACYTYGSPRVGNEEWMLGIKPPVYRLVNSADPVTMLPPGKDTVGLISFLLKFLPVVGDTLSKKLESGLGGYSHAGYMRFLTNIKDGKYKDAKLLYSVSFMRRISAYITKETPFLKMPSDHSMSTYRKKLQHIAYARQNINYEK